MDHTHSNNGRSSRLLAMSLSLAVLITPTLIPLEAVLVEHTAGSTTTEVFNDNFEGGTLGGFPTATVGSWSFFGSNIHVTNNPSPGANQGTKYLSLFRPPNVASVASADFGAFSSGSLQLTYSLYIPTGSPNFVAGTYLSNQISDNFGGYTTAKVALEVRPTLDNKVYYDNGSTLVDTGVTYEPGTWQTWQINYSFVDGADNDTWRVSVGGAISSPLHGGPGGAESVASLRYLSFRTGANSSEFFVDAIPEPSTVGLLASGLLLVWRFARRNTTSGWE